MTDDPLPSTNPSTATASADESTLAPLALVSVGAHNGHNGNGVLNGNGRSGTKRSRLKDMWRMMRRPRSHGEGSLRETLEELAEQHESDAAPIDPTERLILENTLRLRGQSVEDVMVPRIDIMAVDVNTSVADVVLRIGETHHSRLPVYEGDMDHIVGLVHVKDVLPVAASPDPPMLRSLLRPVMVVAPSMRVLDLLLKMQLERNHMALVVDEFGGIDGLVTIEDLVEQIVGDIEDEHETAEDLTLERRPGGSIIADARVLLEDFEAEVGDILTDEERDNIDTLGGLVFNLVGRVPSRGEIVVHYSGVEFDILEGDPRRLKRLRIRNLPLQTELTESVA
ncbi:MAG: hemolysin family protein [Alphaproteobacteria bacterium]|jgi:CBS domain containing-hemolysin-like protein